MAVCATETAECRAGALTGADLYTVIEAVNDDDAVLAVNRDTGRAVELARPDPGEPNAVQEPAVVQI